MYLPLTKSLFFFVYAQRPSGFLISKQTNNKQLQDLHNGSMKKYYLYNSLEKVTNKGSELHECHS